MYTSVIGEHAACQINKHVSDSDTLLIPPRCVKHDPGGLVEVA